MRRRSAKTSKGQKRVLGYNLLRADGFQVKISHISRKTFKSVKCLFHEKHFGGCCSHTKRPFNHTQSHLGWLNHGGAGMDVLSSCCTDDLIDVWTCRKKKNAGFRPDCEHTNQLSVACTTQSQRPDRTVVSIISAVVSTVTSFCFSRVWEITAVLPSQYSHRLALNNSWFWFHGSMSCEQSIFNSESFFKQSHFIWITSLPPLPALTGGAKKQQPPTVNKSFSYTVMLKMIKFSIMHGTDPCRNKLDFGCFPNSLKKLTEIDWESDRLTEPL